MKVTMPYDEREVVLELHRIDPGKIVGKDYPYPLSNIDQKIKGALDNPLQSKQLRKIIPSGGKISVLISDLTRGRGLKKVLSALLSLLAEWGVENKGVSIILAIGMHRIQNEIELTEHVGRDIVERWNLYQHNAADISRMVEVGTNRDGNPYLFAREVVESDLIIVLGTTSFHYFAGFGGGRKLLLPGIAAEETILSNHRLSLKDDPASGLSDGCKAANLDGNPVHQDMMQGISMISTPIFAINIVWGREGDIVFINAGDINSSHISACKFLKNEFEVELEKKYMAAIISVGGYPKDINLLQSHKAIRYASGALKDGGTMLVAAACREGVGSKSYYDAFNEGRGMVAQKARYNYTLNTQTAISTLELTSKYSIYLASELDRSKLSRFGFDEWKLEDTEDLLKGFSDGEIITILDASSFLPVMPGEN